MPKGLYFMPTLNEGSEDDSSTIQTVIDNMSADGGGAVMFPPRSTYQCNLTLKNDVLLVGVPTVQKNADIGTKLIAAGPGVVIDTPASEIANCGIVGVHVYGLGAGTAVQGVRFRNVHRGVLSNFTIEQCADEGLKIDHVGVTPGDDSIACWIQDGLIQGCLLDTSRSEKTGAADIGGTDHWVRDLEVTASLSALSDANAYICAFVFRGTACRVSGCVGEISDAGFHVMSNPGLHQFTNCRADLNFGHGWEIVGQRNMFTSCLSFRNGRGTHNTYSGFHAASASRFNVFSSCFAGGLGADVGTLAMKYGFEDLVTAGSGRNTYVGCRASSVQTNDYFVNAGGANWDTSTTVVL